MGAARSGRTPRGRGWRQVREVFVADTDHEARDLAVNGAMGRMYRDDWFTLLGPFGFIDYLKHAANVSNHDVTVEYCDEHNWIIGSPATVADKIERLCHATGGFGTLLVFASDDLEQSEAWRRSLELPATQVRLRLRHLVPPA